MVEYKVHIRLCLLFIFNLGENEQRNLDNGSLKLIAKMWASVRNSFSSRTKNVLEGVKTDVLEKVLKKKRLKLLENNR